jgi:hypothetical protein
VSDWNRWMERLLTARPKLTAEEFRLGLALGRLLLGFRVRSDALGDRLVRDTAQFHGRSLEAAREALVAKGLVLFDQGSRGRGNRSVYTLLLGAPEKTGDGRAFEKTGEKTGKKTGEKTGQGRARIKGEKERRTGGDARAHAHEGGDPEPPDFLNLIKPLGPASAGQRREWLEAWEESSEGLARVVVHAQRNGDRPAGMVTAYVRAAAHLHARSRQVPPCAECGTGAGLHAHDCSQAPTLEGEGR